MDELDDYLEPNLLPFIYYNVFQIIDFHRNGIYCLGGFIIRVLGWQLLKRARIQKVYRVKAASRMILKALSDCLCVNRTGDKIPVELIRR